MGNKQQQSQQHPNTLYIHHKHNYPALNISNDLKDGNHGFQILHDQDIERNYFTCTYLTLPELKIALSLKKLNYSVYIVHSLAEVHINQEYKNTLAEPRDLEFIFSVEPENTFTQIEVQLGQSHLIGVIKEKDHNQIINQVFHQRDTKQPDMIRIKLGKLSPGEEVKVKFTLIKKLSVCMNKFWKLTLPATLAPHQQDKLVPPEKQGSFNTYAQVYNNPNYEWNITITIEQPSQIVFVGSPTHKIIKPNALNKTLVNIQLDPNDSTPDRDFLLLFATENIHQPNGTLVKNSFDSFKHQKYLAYLSFIPEFNKMSIQDSYQQYLNEGEDFEFESQGNFIFLVDRSHSMGVNIEKAKEALILFVKSLPENSYFNIISFGDKSKTLFQHGSVKLDERSQAHAIAHINDFHADMGGTDIYQALEMVFKKQQKVGYSTNLFLLSDGTVKDSDSVISLIEEKVDANIRVYGIGVGDKCSHYLIEKAATLGNGKFEFISENESLNQKVIYLLKDAITPFYQRFTVSTDQTEKQNAIYPNPDSVLSIRKNEPVTFYLTFDSSLEEQSEVNIHISCEDQFIFHEDPDSKTKIIFQTKLFLADAVENNLFHKFFAFKQLQAIEKAVKYQTESVDDFVLFSDKIKFHKETVVEISTHYQILCPLTVFVCEFKEGDKISEKKVAVKFPSIVQQVDSQGEQIKSLDMSFEQSEITQNLLQNQDNDVNKQLEQQEEQKQHLTLTEREPFNNKPKSYIQVVVQQNLDGSFDFSNDILNGLNVEKSKLEFTKPEELKDQVWVTVWVLKWLDTYFPKDRDALELIVKKSKQFLRNNNVMFRNYVEKVQI